MHASDPVLAEAGMRLPALRGGEPEGGAEAEFTHTPNLRHVVQKYRIL